MLCNVRSSTRSTANKAVKSKIIKPKQKKTVAKVNKEAIKDETAYERVLRKVNERKAARGEELIGSQSNKSQVKTNKKGNNSKIAEQSRQQSISPNEESDSVNAQFLADDNYADMDISGIRSVFPSKDEDEESEYWEVELMETEETRNNNTTLPIERIQNMGSALSALPGWCGTRDQNNNNWVEPHCSKDDPPQWWRIMMEISRLLLSEGLVIGLQN